MSEILFDVIFKGKFSNQIDKNQAVNNFAKIFKQPPEKAVLFFDGKPRALKKSLSMDKANHIRAVLKKAGLRVTLQKLASAEEKPPIQPEVPVVEHNKEWDVDQPGVVIVKKTIVPPPNIDTSDLTLDEVGVVFAKKESVPKLEFDLHELTLDEVGAIFAEEEIIEVPEFDIDDIEVEQVGAVMAEKEEVPEPEFDFDGLDVEEPGAVLPQPKKPEKPEIDTDGIELE
jgi:hypothetical protein